MAVFSFCLINCWGLYLRYCTILLNQTSFVYTYSRWKNHAHSLHQSINKKKIAFPFEFRKIIRGWVSNQWSTLTLLSQEFLGSLLLKFWRLTILQVVKKWWHCLYRIFGVMTNLNHKFLTPLSYLVSDRTSKWPLFNTCCHVLF